MSISWRNCQKGFRSKDVFSHIATRQKKNGIENSFHDETEAATLQETPPKGIKKAHQFVL